MYMGTQAACFRTLEMTVETVRVVTAEKLQELFMLTFKPMPKDYCFDDCMLLFHRVV